MPVCDFRGLYLLLWFRLRNRGIYMSCGVQRAKKFGLGTQLSFPVIVYIFVLYAIPI